MRSLTYVQANGASVEWAMMKNGRLSVNVLLHDLCWNKMHFQVLTSGYCLSDAAVDMVINVDGSQLGVIENIAEVEQAQAAFDPNQSDDAYVELQAVPNDDPSVDDPPVQPQPGNSFSAQLASNLKKNLTSFIQDQENQNTRKKTDSCVKRFKSWLLTQKNIIIDPVEIPPGELDTLIGEWLLSLKKATGGDYEPDSLTSFHRGIARYLRDSGYGIDIVNHPSFQTSNRVLGAKRKQLKAAGLGNKSNKAEPLSDEHVKQLWRTGTMGLHSAKKPSEYGVVHIHRRVWSQSSP